MSRKLKLAWLSPLDVGNGVARYTASVAPILAELAEVDVWAPSGRDHYRLGEVTVRRLDSNVRLAGEYDLVVYNLGNHPASFVSIYDQYRRRRGLVVLHDKRMHGFFNAIWAHMRGEPKYYLCMLRHYYGSRGEEVGRAILGSQAGVDDHEDVPLLEPCLWNASGVVTHSMEASGLVHPRYRSLLPVAMLPLPFSSDELGCLDQLPSRKQLGIPDSTVLIVSHGGVYPQKRLATVIRALASDRELINRVLLVIAGGGDPAYQARLQSLVRELGIEANVRVAGFLPDEVMYAYLKAADICVNLRYPSMESASLSLIEQLSFGKPVVVTDVSYYSELPDDVVIKIPLEGEQARLTEALLHLTLDLKVRAHMGHAARQFAREHHDPVRYAGELVAFARRVIGNQRLSAVDEASARSAFSSLQELKDRATLLAREFI